MPPTQNPESPEDEGSPSDEGPRGTWTASWLRNNLLRSINRPRREETVLVEDASTSQYGEQPDTVQVPALLWDANELVGPPEREQGTPGRRDGTRSVLTEEDDQGLEELQEQLYQADKEMGFDEVSHPRDELIQQLKGLDEIGTTPPRRSRRASQRRETVYLPKARILEPTP